MNILLIRPVSKKSGILTNAFSYKPLTLEVLASVIPAKYRESISFIDESVTRINFDVPADIVIISAITPTINRAYEVADNFRTKGATVIIGGIHAALCPDEAIVHADAVTTGPAEIIFPQLFADIENNNLQRFYNQKHTPLNCNPIRLSDLIEMPCKKEDYIIRNTIQVTMGCKNNCSYCSLKSVYGSQYIMQPISEVRSFLVKRNWRKVTFLDANLFCDREYVIQLTELLKELNIKWIAMAPPSVGMDLELLDCLSDSGCKSLMLGFESVDQAALKSVNKGQERSRRYVSIIKSLHERNIAVFGSFIFGLDTDTVSTFDETINFAINSKLDIVRYTIFTPYPGTPEFSRMKKEDRLLTTNWDRYDCENVVFEPKNMTKKELEDGYKYAWKKTYSKKSILKRLLFRPALYPETILVNLSFNRYISKTM